VENKKLLKVFRNIRTFMYLVVILMIMDFFYKFRLKSTISVWLDRMHSVVCYCCLLSIFIDINVIMLY